MGEPRMKLQPITPIIGHFSNMIIVCPYKNKTISKHERCNPDLTNEWRIQDFPEEQHLPMKVCVCGGGNLLFDKFL